MGSGVGSNTDNYAKEGSRMNDRYQVRMKRNIPWRSPTGRPKAYLCKTCAEQLLKDVEELGTCDFCGGLLGKEVRLERDGHVVCYQCLKGLANRR